MLRRFPHEVLLRLPRVGQGFRRTRRRLLAFRGRLRREVRVKLILANQRRIDPWQLVVRCLLPNVVSNPAHYRVDGDARVEQVSEERLCERAVLTGWPIEGGALWIAGERDQCAAREIAVDAGQSA